MATSNRPLSLRRSTLKLAAAALACAALPAVAQAPAWPTKAVRIVVGFAPGGTTDVMARTLAQALTEALGQTVIVDNKPGASGNLAAGEVIKAAPDGYTLLIAPTSVETANPSLFKSNLLPSRDLAPVMSIGRLTRELNKALAAPALKQRFGDLGAEPVALDTPAFKKLLADEGKQLSTLIKDRKIIVE
jgi:tripartite-type tricarboxylate transporter receptor subunit TctC